MNELMNPPCPRQAEAGSTFAANHKCEWRDDTWIAGKEIVTGSKWEGGKETVLSRGIAWRIEWGQPPKTCSYCGGIKPSDLLRMLNEGWEIEATTKDYKRYIHPPGAAKLRQKCMDDLKDGKLPERSDGPMTPIPCVKFYVYHCTKEEIDRLNFEMKNRKD